MAILGNGRSLLDHDLSRITVPTIGLNRSWRLHGSTYFVCADYRHYCEAFDRMKHLFVSGFASAEKWGVGTRVKALVGGDHWSDDLERGWVLCHTDGPGSVLHASLQLAKWLGFQTAYLLGTDFHGPHFDGTEAYGQMDVYHNKLMAVARQRSGMDLYVCGSPDSRCELPKVGFEEVCR